MVYVYWCAAIHGVAKSWTRLRDWTELNWTELKQFLQSFSIKHITGIPYNLQAQGIVERAHHTLKLQIKKLKKGEYTATLLSSLFKADFTRFQQKTFSNPITTVNTASFVLNFLNLTQGNMQKSISRNWRTLSSSAHLVPRWVNETMEIWETNLTGKGVCLYFPRWIQWTHMASSLEDSTQEGTWPSKWRWDNKNPRRKKFQYRPWRHHPYDLPTWEQIKTLTNQDKNLVSWQEMPQSLENLSWPAWPPPEPD